MTELDDFYATLKRVTSEEKSLRPIAKTIALFRVAVEFGGVHMGFPRLTFLMSRLLTVTLGITAGDEESSYEEILEDFGTDEKTKH